MENRTKNSSEVMRVTGIGMLWNIILGAFKITAGVIGSLSAAVGRHPN